MKTIVTTHPKNEHLLEGFCLLATKFYGEQALTVEVAKPDESKSDQLLRILSNISDRYFILLEEDFYIVKPVPIELLRKVWNYCWKNNVDRFSLQSKNTHSFTDWKETEDKIGDYLIYQTVPEVEILFSLEASIWKREFLLRHLEKELSDAQIEVEVSHKLRNQNISHKIYALDKIVIEYRDVMRDGREEIRLLRSPLRMTGPALALYPQGGEESEELSL
jgi:hypothetical protein